MEVEEIMRIYTRKKPEKDVTGSQVQILQIATCCEEKKEKSTNSTAGRVFTFQVWKCCVHVQGSPLKSSPASSQPCEMQES